MTCLRPPLIARRALLVALFILVLGAGSAASASTEVDPFVYDAGRQLVVDEPLAASLEVVGATAANPFELVRSRAEPAATPTLVGHVYDVSDDFVAPNSTRIFRAVEPDELADLRSFGQYRAGGPHAEWLDGKRFWLSQADADAYVAFATKADLGGPYCVTSGCIPNSVLDQIQVVTMDGMDAVFLPNELLPFINDLSLPSPP